jgi:hypothetical protein
VFGFSLSDSKNARELLLIVWFSLHYYRMTKSRERTYCEEILECLLEKRAGNNSLALAAMMLRYGIEPGPFQLAQQGARPGMMRLVLLLGFLVLHVGWQVTLVVIVAAVQIGTVISILRDPSVAEWVSVLVTLYVLSISLVSFGMSKLFGIGRVKNKPPIYLPE